MNFTIVYAARVDDYLPRLRKSLCILSTLAYRIGFRPDIIIVEWNPTPGNQGLAWELMDRPRLLPIRIITVSPEIHNSTPGSDQLPFFEYTAKNVGIRRAADGMVLTTNADDIFSEAMVKRLASEPWVKGCFYRANRHDTEIGAAVGSTADEIIQNCSEHVWRIVKADDGAGGDFMLMDRDRWAFMGGHPELVSADTIDTYTIELAQKKGLQQIVFDEPMYHQGHAEQRTGWASIFQRIGPSVHSGIMQNAENWGLRDLVLPEVTI